MNVILDTNVIISGLIYDGKPGLILDLVTANSGIKAITSPALIDELCGVLEKKFNYDAGKVGRVKQLIRNTFIIVSPVHVPEVIKEDPPDNQLLAITHEIPIRYIVSGNKHLLKLRQYNSALVVKPDQFITISYHNTRLD